MKAKNTVKGEYKHHETRIEKKGTWSSYQQMAKRSKFLIGGGLQEIARLANNSRVKKSKEIGQSGTQSKQPVENSFCYRDQACLLNNN